ncbi:MAG: DUF2283 domain-containing protein [Rubrobacteraceae bacterium]
MYIERDKEFDQLYINLADHSGEGSVAETVEATPGVSLDLDDSGRLVGIEITGARSIVGTPAAEMDFTGELVGVKEAAKISGKDKANFLRDLASREDFPKPIVSLASGRYWLSAEIERYLHKEKITGQTGSPRGQCNPPQKP